MTKSLIEAGTFVELCVEYKSKSSNSKDADQVSLFLLESVITVEKIF